MFLRCNDAKENGKEHRYWNLVESRRVAGGQMVQRQVLTQPEADLQFLLRQLKLELPSRRRPKSRRPTDWSDRAL